MGNFGTRYEATCLICNNCRQKYIKRDIKKLTKPVCNNCGKMFLIHEMIKANRYFAEIGGGLHLRVTKNYISELYTNYIQTDFPNIIEHEKHIMCVKNKAYNLFSIMREVSKFKDIIPDSIYIKQFKKINIIDYNNLIVNLYKNKNEFNDYIINNKIPYSIVINYIRCEKNSFTYENDILNIEPLDNVPLLKRVRDKYNFHNFISFLNNGLLLGYIKYSPKDHIFLSLFTYEIIYRLFELVRINPKNKSKKNLEYCLRRLFEEDYMYIYPKKYRNIYSHDFGDKFIENFNYLLK